MVKLKRIIQDFPVTRKAICSLYCTSIDDFSGDYEVEGLPTDYTLDIGSEAITKDFDLLQLTEDGWVKYTVSAPTTKAALLLSKGPSEENDEDVPEYKEEDPNER